MSHEEDKFEHVLGGAADYLKRHRLQHKAAKLALKPAIMLGFLMKGNARLLMAIGGAGEETRGLLEGSIIGGHLAYPDSQSGSLLYTQAEAGHWLAYDFRRPTEFPPGRSQKKGPDQLYKGKLFGIMLEEIMGNSANQRTPTSLLRLTNLDHALRLAAPSISTLVDNELVVPTTYQQAYQQAGVYEQHAEDLSQRGLSEHPVHAVTPKGNTLVFLLPAFGSPNPRPEAEAAADLELGLA